MIRPWTAAALAVVRARRARAGGQRLVQPGQSRQLRGATAVRHPGRRCQLGAEPAARPDHPAGGSFLVKRRADGNCIMDIRAVFADGRGEERKSLNTCAIDAVAVGLATTAGKPADDPSVKLVNRGNQPITEFFVAPVGHQAWGQNRLVEGPLPAATEKLIRIAKGECIYDLRVVFADRTAKEKHGADLCKISDLPVP